MTAVQVFILVCPKHPAQVPPQLRRERVPLDSTCVRFGVTQGLHQKFSPNALREFMQVPAQENLPCMTKTVLLTNGNISVDDGAALDTEKDLRLKN